MAISAAGFMCAAVVSLGGVQQQATSGVAGAGASVQRPPLSGPVLPAGSAGQGRGTGLPVPIREDETGFVSLFDGNSLNGWDGNPIYWRVEEQAIVGETRSNNIPQRNTFLIWKGGNVRDFELKVDFKLVGDIATANSGVMYRAVSAGEPWSIKGYQADMDLAGYYIGNIHGERDCPCQMAPRAQFTRAGPDGSIKLLAQVSDVDTLRGHMNIGEWNSYHLIVRGNFHALIMNGHLTSVFINDDPKTRWAAEGMLGLQLHNGPPEKVMFKNVRYRQS